MYKYRQTRSQQVSYTQLNSMLKHVQQQNWNNGYSTEKGHYIRESVKNSKSRHSKSEEVMHYSIQNGLRSVQKKMG